MVFSIHHSGNKAAVYEEAPGGGDTEDFSSARNRPLMSPQDWVTRVQWHSDFFQYELAMPEQTVSVSHPSVAGKVTEYGGTGFFFAIPKIIGWGRTVSTQHTLLTHNLGYAPLVYAIYNGVLVSPGTIVQTQSGGRSRMVSIFATTSIIGLHEVGRSSNQALSAVSRSYRLLVFREPAADPTKPLFGKDGDQYVFGRGKVDTAHQYMRKVRPGETPYIIPLGPIGDHRNGRKRVVLGNTVITEDGYTGNFTGPPYLTIGV